MPSQPSPPDVVDLSSDDEIGNDGTPAPNPRMTRANERPQAAALPLSELHSGHLPARQVPTKARLHGGYDLDTLEYEEHLIPDGQLKCRGCRLSPIEFDENGDEIPAAVTHEKRLKILMDRFHEKWAQGQAKENGANHDTANTALANTQKEVVNPSVTSRLIHGQRRAIPSHVIDLDTSDTQSAGSRTEPGSSSDDDIQIQPEPASTSLQGTMPPGPAPRQATLRPLVTSKNKDRGKGKGREKDQLVEIDLSLLESDEDDLNVRSKPANNDDAPSSPSDDEDLRRAIALSLQDNATLDTVDNNDGSLSGSSATERSPSTNRAGEARQKFEKPIVVNTFGVKNTSDNGKTKASDTNPDRLPHIPLMPRIVRPGGQDSLHSTLGDDKPVSPSPGPGATTSFSRTRPQIQNEGVSSSSMISAADPDGARTKTTNPTATFNLTVLDRKQMEVERLARLKRKRQGEDHDEDHDEGDGDGIPSNKAARVDRFTSTPQSRGGTISPPPLRRSRETTQSDSVAGVKRHVSLSTAASATAGPSTTNNTIVHAGDGVSGKGSEQARNQPSQNYYPKGVVLRTHVAGADTATNTDTIDFPTLIAPASKLESCLLSSFIWDFDWLLPHFETQRTKFQLVMHAKGAVQREALKADFHGVPNVRLCFPPMDPNVNCMHSKLILLFYNDDGDKDKQCVKGSSGVGGGIGSSTPSGKGDGSGPRCRIVVPTANLVNFDWGVGGIMENTVWLIDLPLLGKNKGIKKPGGSSSSSSTATNLACKDTANATLSRLPPTQQTQFQKALTAFLRAQTVPDDVTRKLELFDFGETAQLGFVHTIGGTHGGQGWRTTGLCGLGQTIADLGLAPPPPCPTTSSSSRGAIELDYVTSSLGSLTDEFMDSIYLAAQGRDGLAEYNRRTRTAAKKGSGARMAVAKRADSGGGEGDCDLHHHCDYNWKENMRVYYPSDETVRRSRGGPGNAGTICFSSKWWHNGKFPKSNMRDCVSVRQGLLMHNKVCVFLPSWQIALSMHASPPAGRLAQRAHRLLSMAKADISM